MLRLSVSSSKPVAVPSARATRSSPTHTSVGASDPPPHLTSPHRTSPARVACRVALFGSARAVAHSLARCRSVCYTGCLQFWHAMAPEPFVKVNGVAKYKVWSNSVHTHHTHTHPYTLSLSFSLSHLL